MISKSVDLSNTLNDVFLDLIDAAPNWLTHKMTSGRFEDRLGGYPK